MAARSLTLVKTTPTREDMVMRDDYDPLMATAVAARPARERPFQAVRRALTETLAQLADHEVAIVRERTRSCSRCRHYGRLHEQSDVVASRSPTSVATRMRRPPDDLAVQGHRGSLRLGRQRRRRRLGP